MRGDTLFRMRCRHFLKLRQGLPSAAEHSSLGAGAAAQAEAFSYFMGAVNKYIPEKRPHSFRLFPEDNSSDFAAFGHNVRSAENRIRVLALTIERQIFLGFWTAIGAEIPAARHVAVVVVLVRDRRIRGHIDDRQMLFPRVLDEPLVEPDPTNGERRNVAIDAAWKGEEVDAGVRLEPAFAAQTFLQLPLPAGGELERLRDVEIGAPADGEKFWKARADFGDAVGESLEQDDVRIDVGEYVVRGVFFRLGQNVGKEGSAVAVAGHLGKMGNAQFARGFGGAFLGAEQHDLRTRAKSGPTGDGVALDDGDVAAKGFGGRADR